MDPSGKNSDDHNGGRSSPSLGIRGRSDPGAPYAVLPAQARISGERPTGLIVALSGRNQLRGFVEEVRIDGLLGQVRLRIGDQRLTAIITSDALSVLKLRRGDSALAIVKATEVMIAREADPIEPPVRRRRRT